MAVAVAELGYLPRAHPQSITELTPHLTLEDFISSIQHRDPKFLSPFGQDSDDLFFTVPQIHEFLLGLKRTLSDYFNRPTFLNSEPTDRAMSELAAFSGFQILNDSQIKPSSVDVAYYRPQNSEKLVDFLRRIRPLLAPHGRAVLLVPSEHHMIPTDTQGEREVYGSFEVDMTQPIVYPEDPISGNQPPALFTVFRLLPLTYVHQ